MNTIVKTSNKYSDKKIVWFNEKLESLKDNIITAPIYVRVKPINICCHHCPYCIHRYKDTMKETDILSKNKIFEILDDFKDMGVKCVTYSGGGEPLMHPNIVEILEKTKNNNVDLSIITNGQLLNGNRAKSLADAKWVRISVDYCDENSFVNAQRGTKQMYKQIIFNIENFNKIKNKNCELTVNYIVTKENVSIIIKAAELLKSIGVSNIRYSPVSVKNFIEYHTSIKEEVLSLLKSVRLLESDNFKIYDSYNITPNVLKRSYIKCFILQIIPVIGADEIVYNCHNKLYTHDGIIGSIKNQSFKQLWYSKETKNYFDSFNAQICCNCQCANDNKNIFLHEIIDCYGDNFV